MKPQPRQTVAKRAIQEFMHQHKGPVSEMEIRSALVKAGVRVHKTTVYRQLETLAASGWATVTRFADGVARYERQTEHHHHLVCRLCSRVEEVVLDEQFLHIERKLAQAKQFRNVSHLLEFFGTCAKCATAAV